MKTPVVHVLMRVSPKAERTVSECVGFVYDPDTADRIIKERFPKSKKLDTKKPVYSIYGTPDFIHVEECERLFLARGRK